MEKWNFSRRLETKTPEAEIPEWVDDAVCDIIRTGFGALKKISELPKNTEEQKFISITCQALTELLADLHLPPYEVPENNIHIVTKEDYEKYLVSGRGKTIFDQVFIQRSEDPVRFLRDLSHEIVHLASLSVLLLQHEQVPHEGKLVDNIFIGQRRSGFSFSPKGKNDRNYKLFHGLNEGVIELAAAMIRKNIISKQMIDLTNGQKRKMKAFAYPHAIVLLELARKISTSSEEAKVLIKMLMKDVFTGSYRVIKEIGKNWRHKYAKNIVPLLSTMDASEKSAYEAALALGFDEIAQDIRDQLKPESG